jgi:hypothetical protein
MLTISYKTHIPLSFTHNRLLKYKAGPGVQPGTFPRDGDLAKSWSQPNESTYPNGFPVTVCFATYGSTTLVDTMTLSPR